MLSNVWSLYEARVQSLRHTWVWRVLRVIRWCLPLVLLAVLGRQLISIGWSEIWHSRPNGWVILILLLLFCVQPLADCLIYQYLWKVDLPQRLTVFFRKRFMNSVMLEYSGEAYFFAWAANHVKISKTRLFHAIKDSNVLSAGAGLVLLCLLLLAAVAITPPGALVFSFTDHWSYFAVVLFPLGLCGALFFARRRITILERQQIVVVFGIHLVRGMVSQLVQLGVWIASGVVGSIESCLTFVLLRLIISRLPIGANKEIIFFGAGLVAADSMHLPVQPVAALLVVVTASHLVFDLLLVGLPWLVSRLTVASRWTRNPVTSGDVSSAA